MRQESATTVLVTGATGFLGRRLCQRLQSEHVRVIGTGRKQASGPWDDFIPVDLAKADPPESLFNGVTSVFHLASKAHALADKKDDADSYRPIIVEGTRRLVKAASVAGVKGFIYMSSVKAMGEGNPVGLPLSPINESWPNSPQSPYGLAKAEAEHIVLESGITHAVVVRPVMVYGPGEKGNLPRLREAIQKGRFPPIPDTGNKRSMIHIDDLIEIIMRAAYFPVATGRVYIAAGSDALSTRQLYNIMRESLGLNPIGWSIPLWLLKSAAAIGSIAGELSGKRMPLDLETLGKLINSSWFDCSRAMKELDYRPQHCVEEWLKSKV